MNIINGKKFADFADIQISKEEHYYFEFGKDDNPNWYDIDKVNFLSFDNPSVVYVNSSLLSNKPKLKSSNLITKLSYFKNPFTLILHNSDGNFEEFESRVLELDNVTHVYSQNLNFNHDKVSPLPIGIANPIWDWGSEDMVNEVISIDVDANNFIYANFKIDGGLRPIDRQPCKDWMDLNELKMNEVNPFRDYLLDLKSHKYSLCPQGNGYDTHRFWESLYMKTIPIVKRTVMTEFWENFFPIILIDDWNDIDLEKLKENYEDLNKWDNYDLLDFNNYIKNFITIK
jgi:hypothetical protein